MPSASLPWLRYYRELLIELGATLKTSAASPVSRVETLPFTSAQDAMEVYERFKSGSPGLWFGRFGFSNANINYSTSTGPCRVVYTVTFPAIISYIERRDQDRRNDWMDQAAVNFLDRFQGREFRSTENPTGWRADQLNVLSGQPFEMPDVSGIFFTCSFTTIGTGATQQ